MFESPFPLRLKHFTVLNIKEDYDVDYTFAGTFVDDREVNLTSVEVILTDNNSDTQRVIRIVPHKPGQYEDYFETGKHLSSDILGYLIRQLTEPEPVSLNQFINDIFTNFANRYDVYLDGQIQRRVIVVKKPVASAIDLSTIFDRTFTTIVDSDVRRQVGDELTERYHDPFAYLNYLYQIVVETGQPVTVHIPDISYFHRWGRAFQGTTIVHFEDNS